MFWVANTDGQSDTHSETSQFGYRKYVGAHGTQSNRWNETNCCIKFNRSL